MPRVTVAPHTPALASDFNTVSDQSIMVFATAAQRTTAIPTPAEGMHTYRSDADVVEYWNGSAWVAATLFASTGFRGNRVAALGVAVGWIQVPLDSEVFDLGNNHAAATGYTVPATGYYQINAQITVTINNNPQRLVAGLFVDGAEVYHGDEVNIVGWTGQYAVALSMVDAFTAGKNLTLYLYNGGGNSVSIAGQTFLTVHRVG